MVKGRTLESYVIPVDVLPEGELAELMAKFAKEALAVGSKIRADSLVLRMASPRDFGLDTNNWVFNIDATEKTIIQLTVPDNVVLYIFGIANLSTNPVVTRVLFGSNAGPIFDAVIEHLYAFDHYVGILKHPVIAYPNMNLKVDVKALATNPNERLMLLAYVVEPEGKTINIPG